MTEKEEKTNSNKIPLFPFQLVDVRLFEIIANRCDTSEELKKNAPISIELSSPTDDEIGDEFGLLLTFKTLLPIDEKPNCEIEISIEGIFHTLAELDEIQSEVIENFISKDAIVLFWPYLRQYLHDITEKMRLGMRPLPIIDPRALVERSAKK